MPRRRPRLPRKDRAGLGDNGATRTYAYGKTGPTRTGNPRKKVITVAANTGRGYRRGAVTGRSQVKTSSGWTKRDTGTGRFVDGKADGNPFKGVRKEN
jgi:hypothetical protein